MFVLRKKSSNPKETNRENNGKHEILKHWGKSKQAWAVEKVMATFATNKMLDNNDMLTWRESERIESSKACA